jgi:transposase
MTSTTRPGADPAPKPKRRTFSAEYKLRIVAEYDAAPAGEKGAILRRERLYSSHVIEWRQARDAGALNALTDHRTAPARSKRHPAEAEAARLRKENERLRQEVARKDAALEVLGKTHALLETLSGSAG